MHTIRKLARILRWWRGAERDRNPILFQQQSREQRKSICWLKSVLYAKLMGTAISQFTFHRIQAKSSKQGDGNVAVCIRILYS